MFRYGPIVYGTFQRRRNRFTAEILVEDKVKTVHVKNTGRCSTVLQEGAQTVLEKSDRPGRKTAFDLIAAFREGIGWVNLDSQVPNRLMKEALEEQKGITLLKPEYTYGESRIDFYLEKDGRRILIEVKGCTLACEGEGLFPDAPTARGAKHLRELEKAVGEGYEAILAFVIAIPGVDSVRVNAELDPDFAKAYEEAVFKGIRVLCVPCEIGPDWIRMAKDVEI